MTEKILYEVKECLESMKKMIEMPNAPDSDPEGMLDYCLSLINNQPTFEVGEYYVSDDGDIYKITSQENLLITVKLYSISSGRFLDMTIPSHDPQDKPATAEEIAEFKRAEHFAAHRRKLDEFRSGDLIEKDGEMNILGNISMNEYGDVIADGYKMTLGKLAGRYKLVLTAEELREVEG